MDTNAWAETATIIGTVIGAMFTGILAGRKGGKKDTPAGEATVLTASVTDNRALRTLSDEVGELRGDLRDAKELRHADSRAERDCMESLTRALRENTDARRNPSLTPEMAVMLARLSDHKE